MKITRTIGTLINLLSITTIVQSKDEKPNIVVLMADDLGIGDLGCYGNTTIPTPNIDSLCQDGVRFNHHLSAAALCTPSRAAFLTGRYPIRMGLAAEDGTPPVILYVSARNGLPETEKTWASHLKVNGYTTFAVGKWHLGWDRDSYGDQKHGPLGHGFDHFYGLPFTLVDGFEQSMPFFTYSKFSSDESILHNHATALVLSLITVLAVYSKDVGYVIFVLMIIIFAVTWFFLEHFALHTEKWWQRSLFMEKFLNSILMEDREVVEQPIRLPKLMQRLTDKTLQYIEEARNHSKPFAIYHAFSAVHTPLNPGHSFRGKSSHGPYGDSILEMDHAVGQILDALKRNGLEKDTLVYFTSDHGSHIDLGRRGGSNSPFKGGKGMDPLEGGIRVPGIMKWPAKIRPGKVVNAPTSHMDFLPTLQELVEAQEVIEEHKEIDGKSYLRHLSSSETSSSKESTENRIFRHYCGSSLHALRLVLAGNVYKVYRKYPSLNKEGHCGQGQLCPCFGHKVQTLQEFLIFDLNEDPLEERPLKKEMKSFVDVEKLALRAFEEADSEEHPPSQYSSYFDVMPRPMMQPCANFPRCQT